jgi:hypothetical protein
LLTSLDHVDIYSMSSNREAGGIIIQLLISFSQGRCILEKHDIRPTETGNAKPQQNNSILPTTPIKTSCETVFTTEEIQQHAGVPVDNSIADHTLLQ